MKTVSPSDPSMLDTAAELAVNGGPRAVQTPIAPRRRHGELDKRLLAEVIDSEMLFYFWGTKVREFEREFAALYGKKYCVACASGSAAVHIAVAALQLRPGTEVITAPITDMGTLTGILYQGLIPVFADVDPETLNLDPS
ncbi:MAG TPA: DegT/DnrJ/EryC1/StrS family aminotransferase, partial [Bryobacteraceae bacterium]|nr:DegT/DnrJ/EryC1/StrS family aminotransferase [Bryobacteraceae bacterium]